MFPQTDTEFYKFTIQTLYDTINVDIIKNIANSAKCFFK